MFIPNKHRYTIVYFPSGRVFPDPFQIGRNPIPHHPHRNHPNVYCGTKKLFGKRGYAKLQNLMTLIKSY